MQKSIKNLSISISVTILNAIHEPAREHVQILKQTNRYVQPTHQHTRIFIFPAGDIFRHRDLQNSDSKKVHNERVPTSHLSTMLVSPPKTNATFVVRKPMAPAILLSHTQPKSNASTEVDEDNQMASLCWHTHGSSFWHHLLITAEHVDSI